MKKRKATKINDTHIAVVEFENSYVTIWIEEKYKWLWFESYRRVSWVELYELGKEDRIGGCCLQGVFCGRHMTLDIKHRNLHTFSLKREIDTLYASYLKARSDGLKKAKQIDNLLNQL